MKFIDDSVLCKFGYTDYIKELALVDFVQATTEFIVSLKLCRSPSNKRKKKEKKKRIRQNGKALKWITQNRKS
jgi:N-glycosylase/DNA lyase